VNATPSGSCTPPAGGRGGSKARRVRTTTGLSSGPSRIIGPAGHAGRTSDPGPGLSDGTRCAKTVRRGVLSARHSAQGRVGGNGPRHVAILLVGHPLLSANTSAVADAVRPRPTCGARPWPSAESTAPLPASRTEAQPTERPSADPEARDTELVPPARVVATPCRGHSRGKGVLAV
jgi:hypothetical protein